MRTLLAALITLSLAGCSTTYEQLVTGTDGAITIYEETHKMTVYSTPFEPDHMSLRHSRTIKAGQVLAEKTCKRDGTTQVSCIILK